MSTKSSIKSVPCCAQIVAQAPPPPAGAAARALGGGAGPAAERRPLILGASVAQRQAEPGQQEEEGHMPLKLVYPHADIY